MATISFEHTTQQPSQQQIEERERGRKGRPSFSSQKTNDRLRESDRRPSTQASTKTYPQTQRRSVFREEGLDDLNTSVHIIREGEIAPDIGIDDVRREDFQDERNVNGKRNAPKAGGLFSRSKLGKSTGSEPGPRTTMPASTTAPPPPFSTLPRAALIILLVAMVVPGFRYGGGNDKVMMGGADADVIRTAEMVENGSMIEGRQASPTSVCTRWAHQGMFEPPQDSGCVLILV